jgi:voltage-gated potassium channel
LPKKLSSSTKGSALCASEAPTMPEFPVVTADEALAELRRLLVALRASRLKITVFLFGVLVLVSIYGSVMYLVEGSSNEGFSSIPRSIYWAIVTLTTVGFGDITPQTPFGQFLASLVMITGYAVIAVPTGIMSAELMRQVGVGKEKSGQTCACPDCGRDDHEADASYCRFCGGKL